MCRFTYMVLALLFVGICLFPSVTSIFCRPPPSPGHGVVHNTANRTFFMVGQEVSYTCNTGYVLVGKERRRCKKSPSSGRYYWEGTPPLCKCKCVTFEWRTVYTEVEDCIYRGCLLLEGLTSKHGISNLIHCREVVLFSETVLLQFWDIMNCPF